MLLKTALLRIATVDIFSKLHIDHQLIQVGNIILKLTLKSKQGTFLSFAQVFISVIVNITTYHNKQDDSGKLLEQ